MEQNPETLGSRLKQLRAAKNLSQEAVADPTGIGKGYLSDLENDKVKPGSINLSKLADFYGVPADWLLTGKDTRQDNVSEPKPVYSCEVKMVLPEPSNELIENLNIIRDVLEHGPPKPKAWLEGQIKWTAWKLKNW